MASSVSSLLTAAVITPFDVITRRMQATAVGSALRERGAWAATRTIVRAEGVRALYRGLVPTLALLLPSNAMYFPLYESLRDRLERAGGESARVSAPLVAGMAARSMVVLVTAPVEYVRTNMQGIGVLSLHRCS